jgi:hypothetical protein
VRRFVTVRGQDRQWMVLDLNDEPRQLCICTGFKAPLNAEYIADALEYYHSDLMAKVLGS